LSICTKTLERERGEKGGGGESEREREGSALLDSVPFLETNF